MLDELHQTLVPSRTGSGIDVLVDTTGATIGTLLFTRWRTLPGLAPGRRQRDGNQ